MRDAFFDELTRLGREDPRLIFLTGDLGYKLWDEFAATCPGRFLNMGVAEANMVSVAAGLALSGMRPITYSIVPFATIRCLEQIRNDVCNMKLPVLIVGVGGGYAYGANGPTHHGIDDVAAMRTLPGMTIFCPCDPQETRAALRAAHALEGPAFLRLGRNREPNLTHPGAPFTPGRPTLLRDGGRVALLAVGPIAGQALAAADLLRREGVDPAVWSVHTVKPLDGLVACMDERAYEHVFVVEEHGPCGGLAEALAAEWADRPTRPRLTRVAAPDAYLHTVGSQQYMWSLAGLDSESVYRRVKERLDRA